MKFVDEQLYKAENGIYMIRNLVTDGVYIGQTSETFLRRYWHHRWKLNDSSHDNKHLQNSWNKYGAENFEFSVVELQEDKDIDKLEQFWISHYRYNGVCYNIQDGGQPERLVDYVTTEARKRVGELNRERMIGTRLSDETKIRMSAARMGKFYPKKNDTMTEVDVARAKHMLINGMSPSEVAKSLGLPYRSINNLLSNNSYKHVVVDGWDEFQVSRPKKRHGMSAEEIEMINNLYAGGSSISQIGEAIGCTYATVKKYLSA